MTSPPRIHTSYMARRDGPEPAADDPLLGFAPVRHKQAKRNSIGPERQRKFIAALAATGIVTDAARAAGATMEAFYHLRQRPGAEEFCAAWDAAVDRAIGRVEDAALARAIDGEERVVVSSGKVLGVERRYNEALVTFLLRKRRPERYGELGAHDLKPGHPVYERIRKEVLDDYKRNVMRLEAITIESVNAKIDAARAREAESKRLLAEYEADLDRKDAEGPARPARPEPRVSRFD